MGCIRAMAVPVPLGDHSPPIRAAASQIGKTPVATGLLVPRDHRRRCGDAAGRGVDPGSRTGRDRPDGMTDHG
jgi:hypothetical protein